MQVHKSGRDECGTGAWVWTCEFFVNQELKVRLIKIAARFVYLVEVVNCQKCGRSLVYWLAVRHCCSHPCYIHTCVCLQARVVWEALLYLHTSEGSVARGGLEHLIRSRLEAETFGSCGANPEAKQVCMGREVGEGEGTVEGAATRLGQCPYP